MSNEKWIGASAFGVAFGLIVKELLPIAISVARKKLEDFEAKHGSKPREPGDGKGNLTVDEYAAWLKRQESK